MGRWSCHNSVSTAVRYGALLLVTFEGRRFGAQIFLRPTAPRKMEVLTEPLTASPLQTVTLPERSPPHAHACTSGGLHYVPC